MEFADILKGREAEGKEKHVPFIEIGKGKGKGEAGADIVHVIVGEEVAHPNTVEHHIAWLDVFGVKQNGQVITLGRSAFAPGYTSPDVQFQVPLAEFKAFCALAYCKYPRGLGELPGGLGFSRACLVKIKNVDSVTSHIAWVCNIEGKRISRPSEKSPISPGA